MSGAFTLAFPFVPIYTAATMKATDFFSLDTMPAPPPERRMTCQWCHGPIRLLSPVRHLRLDGSAVYEEPTPPQVCPNCGHPPIYVGAGES
jgi:rubrerythrin